MKNQTDYFDKVIKVLRDLKKDHPSVEMSKHYSLATDCGSFALTDKELYQALVKYKGELELNTVSDQQLEQIIEDTENLFTEVEPDDEDWEE